MDLISDFAIQLNQKKHPTKIDYEVLQIISDVSAPRPELPPLIIPDCFNKPSPGFDSFDHCGSSTPRLSPFIRGEDGRTPAPAQFCANANIMGNQAVNIMNNNSRSIPLFEVLLCRLYVIVITCYLECIILV